MIKKIFLFSFLSIFSICLQAAEDRKRKANGSEDGKLVSYLGCFVHSQAGKMKIRPFQNDEEVQLFLVNYSCPSEKKNSWMRCLNNVVRPLSMSLIEYLENKYPLKANSEHNLENRERVRVAEIEKKSKLAEAAKQAYLSGKIEFANSESSSNSPIIPEQNQTELKEALRQLSEANKDLYKARTHGGVISALYDYAQRKEADKVKRLVSGSKLQDHSKPGDGPTATY